MPELRSRDQLARYSVLFGVGLAACVTVATSSPVADWPTLRRDGSRNAVSTEKGAPTDWDVGEPRVAGDGRNVVWEAELGSESYGGPVVADGVVWVGTNNESRREPRFNEDGGCLMAFRERDGAFLWQHYTPKHPAGRVHDWPMQGVCSTPLVAGDRLWYCTSRGEVVCLDVSPLRGGKSGAAQELWRLDLVGQLGVFPHNMTPCSPVAHGDLLYVITANGVDETHVNVPAPDAPSVVCLNKETGAVVWSDNSPGRGVLHTQWSSPAIAEVNGKAQVIAPLGDGWVYAYDAATGKVVWKFDTNPKASTYPATRNELIAPPVIHANRMYIANGQDPEHGEGPGHFWCVDVTKAGDVSAELAGEGGGAGKPNPNSAVVWHYEGHGAPGKRGGIPRGRRMNRTISGAVVADGLAFVPDFSGFFHCLDAVTGQHLWTHGLGAAGWCSPIVVDGTVYVVDEDGDVEAFAVARDKRPVAEVNMGNGVKASPAYANGVLYVMTSDRLYAISDGKPLALNRSTVGGVSRRARHARD